MFRKIFIILSSVFCLTPLYAQEPITRDLSSFSKLTVGDRIIVRLVKSSKESALIQAQGIDASAVKTEVSGNALDISIYGKPFTKKKVTITLNYVKLTSIMVNGGAEVSTSSLFKTDTLFVDLKSGGILYLDADIEYLSSKIIEGAILSAEGYATKQDVVVATSGTLSAFELESEIIKVKASSGGKAKINVETELDAEASSNGFISYKGSPSKINRIVNAGGTISVYVP
jgi:hypothetical protein